MAITINASTTNGLVQTADNTGILQLQSNGTTNATLDVNGNFGLGITPLSNPYTGYKTLQIGAQGLISADTVTNGEVYIADNLYRYASTAAFTYINSYAVAYYSQYQGAHRWFIAPSGTAGATATTTQAMTLNNSGYLGIGTTSPSYPLDIGTTSSTNTSSLAAPPPGVIFVVNVANI